ncbi:16S rRNA (guanine(966)-N(2))-methyltransferase RsmD [Clostridiaceae bacterium 35-E11]
MRVIAGSLKGRRLKTPKGIETRPTTDRVKESIFSIIHAHIIDSIIIDLFSGTGNLGIEALSRGAEKVFFVDKNKNSIQLIKENIESMGLKSKSEILFCDALKAIKQLASLSHKFDIIFMDPPYSKGLILPCMEAINAEDMLKEDGIILVEHDTKDTLPDNVGRLIKRKEKKYGNTMISIYAEEASS